MPQKSQYIQAPITAAKLKKALKDGMSFLGADVDNTSLDDTKTADLDFYKSFIRTSTVNLLPESEQLLFTDGSGFTASTDFQKSRDANVGVGLGADLYVEKNTDSNMPYNLINVFKPKPYSADMYQRYGFNTTVGQTYTISFYAAKTESDNSLPSVLQVKVLTSASAELSVQRFTLTDTMTRYSITFTATTTGTDILFGGWLTWRGKFRLSQESALLAHALLNGYNVGAATIPSVVPYSLDDLPENYKNNYLSNIEYLENYTSKLVMPANSSRYGTSHSRSTVLDYGNYGSTGVTLRALIRVTGGDVKIALSNTSQWDQPITSGVQINVADTAGKFAEVTQTVPFSAFSSNSSHYYTVRNVSGISSEVELINLELLFFENSNNPSWNIAHVGSLSAYHYDLRPINQTEARRTQGLIGGLKLAGLQLNVGASAAPYEPVTRWVYKQAAQEYIVDKDLSLAGSALIINTVIPTWASRANIVGEDIKTVAAKAVPQAFNYELRTTSSPPSYVVTERGYTNHPYVDSVYQSLLYRGGASSEHSIGARYSLNSSNLSLMTLNSVHNTGGSAMFSFVPAVGSDNYYPSEAINTTVGRLGYRQLQNKNLKMKVKGMLFQVNLDSTIPIAFNAHIKTPGKGRRKYIHFIVKETSTHYYLHIVTPLVQLNEDSTVGAELSGVGEFNIFTTSGIPSDTVRGETRWSIIDSVSYPDYRTAVISIPKNTDLFVFSQGAADGFTLGFNSGSGFSMLYSVGDLINSSFPANDGTIYTRYAVNTNDQFISRGLLWQAHSPLRFNQYRPSNTGQLGGFLYGDNMSGNDLAELYGEDPDALNRNMVYPMFIEMDNNNNSINLGQVKNFFYSRASLMAGAVGDLLITQDNAKYFTIFKNNVAHYVKV